MTQQQLLHLIPKASVKVLKAKDQNVMKKMPSGGPKWKPVGSPAANTQMSTTNEPDDDDNDLIRDIEGDPFFSSVHYCLLHCTFLSFLFGVL